MTLHDAIILIVLLNTLIIGVVTPIYIVVLRAVFTCFVTYVHGHDCHPAEVT